MATVKGIRNKHISKIIINNFKNTTITPTQCKKNKRFQLKQFFFYSKVLLWLDLHRLKIKSRKREEIGTLYLRRKTKKTAFASSCNLVLLRKNKLFFIYQNHENCTLMSANMIMVKRCLEPRRKRLEISSCWHARNLNVNLVRFYCYIRGDLLESRFKTNCLSTFRRRWQQESPFGRRFFGTSTGRSLGWFHLKFSPHNSSLCDIIVLSSSENLLSTPGVQRLTRTREHL